MNILIPISGSDEFFSKEDFTFPKPLIDILGKSMISHTIESLLPLGKEVRFTFVLQNELCDLYSFDKMLSLIVNGYECNIVRLKKATQGAICSCLMASGYIDPDEELLISNSDQVHRSDINVALDSFRERDLDMGLVTFDSIHPRWSYVSLEKGMVVEASEKKVISNYAIAGLYYFKRGSDFIEAAKRVILNEVLVQNAYYISQSVNEMILIGKKVSHVNIPASSYFNLYSPQKLSEYERFLRDERLQKGSQNDRPVLIIPAAGAGSRFVDAGYENPKPFIDVHGTPMISKVLKNLEYKDTRPVVICRRDHLKKDPKILDWFLLNGVKIVSTDKLTEGTACTVLLALDAIDRDAPLIIANSDQLVDFNFKAYVSDCLDRGLDGSILCFREASLDPKWSYAKVDDAGLVTEVKEKEAISDLATVGIYMFSKGSTFIDSAIKMITQNDRVNGEFYTCPIYNYAIQAHFKIGVYEVEKSSMHGLGTPEDLNFYLSNNKG